MLNTSTSEHPARGNKFHQIAYTFLAHSDPGMLFTSIWRYDKGLFVRINPETYQGKYLCIIPVLDPWRLNENECHKLGMTYFPDSIPEITRRDIHSGKCLLLLDFSNEAASTLKAYGPLLQRLSDIFNPPDGGIIFVQQNRRFPDSTSTGDHEYLRYYSFYYYDYFVTSILDALKRENSSSLNSDSKHSDLNIPDYKSLNFLCLNGTPKPHRLAFIINAISKSWDSQSLMSFLGFDTNKGRHWGPVCSQAIYDDEFLSMIDGCCDRAEIPSVLCNLKKTFLGDSQPDNLNMLAMDIPRDAYAKTCFSVVTESDFSNGSIARITEKTIKSLAMGHPVIILGNPHSIDIVNTLGFRSFDHIIPREYDNENDPVTRFRMSLSAVGRIIKNITDDKQKFLDDIASDSDYNQTYAITLARDNYYALFDEPLLHHISNTLNR